MRARASWPLGAAAAMCLALAACGGAAGPETAVAVAEAPAIAPRATAIALPAPSAPAPADADVAQLARRVAQLELEVATLKAGRTPRPAPAPAPTTTDGTAPPIAEVSFRQEEVDPTWSQMAALRVRHVLGRIDPSLAQRLQRIECRTMNCRLEFDPGDQADAVETTLPRLITELDTTFASAHAERVKNETGPQRTVLFLSR